MQRTLVATVHAIHSTLQVPLCVYVMLITCHNPACPLQSYSQNSKNTFKH